MSVTRHPIATLADPEVGGRPAAGRIKVAQIVDGLRPDGGAEALMRTLLRELRSTSCTPELFVLRTLKDQVRREVDRLGAEVHAFPARRLVDPVRFWRLVRAVRRGRFDVIHAHLTSAIVLGTVCGALLRIPVVVTMHNTHTTSDSHLYHGRLERLLTRRLATRVIGVGHATAAAQEQRLSGMKVHPLANAVESVESPTAEAILSLRESFMDEPGRRLLLGVGRLEPAKAFDDLIDAFDRLHRRRPGVELAIVGKGSQATMLADLIDAKGLGERIHLLGVRSDVRELMAAADVFVMSSRWEGMPVVLLEAMDAGVAVVATDVGDVRGVVADTAARVVDVGRLDDLADAIGETLDELDAGVDVGAAGRAVVDERYSSRSWTNALLRHYRLAITEHDREGSRSLRRLLRPGTSR